MGRHRGMEKQNLQLLYVLQSSVLKNVTSLLTVLKLKDYIRVSASVDLWEMDKIALVRF